MFAKGKINLCASLAFVLVLVCVFEFGATPAQAQISEEMVQHAWECIARTDGFEPVKINYEDNKDPNAWVKFTSGSEYSVHVTRGLMKILNNEDEIAGVLGHELGHIQCGHYKSSMQNNLGVAVLGSMLGSIFDRKGGVARTIGKAGVNVAANLAESGFSRQQEVEADDYGTDLLFKAGYNPMGLYNAMKSFKDNGYNTSPSGFNSHPPTDRRLQHLRERAENLEKQNKVRQLKKK